MIGTNKQKKLKEKRRFILSRLVELGHLPPNKEEYTSEQQVIYDNIFNLDFSYWEEVKNEHGWGVRERLSPDEIYLREKRGRVRTYLRDNNVLPPYGEPLTDEQQKILDDIEKNDFTYFEKLKIEKRKILKENTPLPKNNDEAKSPKVINEKPKKLSDLPGYTATSLPKNVFHRLRMCQILPPLGDELNETQQMIVDDVNKNWLGKTKNHYVIKYVEHSTPEGRLLYRLYKSHLDFGFNFNLTIDDIVIPEKCPLLEVPLSTDPKDFNEPNYYTCDRIDSSKGLVKGNIQVISLRANKMKNKATENELLIFATNGLKILNSIENAL